MAQHTSSNNQPDPEQVRRLAVLLLIPFITVVVFYLVLHALLPPNDGDRFLWPRVPAQYADWLFWSAAGVLVYWQAALTVGQGVLRRLDVLSATDRHPGKPVPVTGRRLVGDILIGVALAMGVMLLAGTVDIDVPALTVALRNNPGLAVALAFVLGFYSEVTRKLLVRLVVRFLDRLLARFGIHILDPEDEKVYVALYVDPQLRAAYWWVALQKAQTTLEACRQKRVRLKVTWLIIPDTGLTVKVARLVFIHRSLLPLPGKPPTDALVQIMSRSLSRAAGLPLQLRSAGNNGLSSGC